MVIGSISMQTRYTEPLNFSRSIAIRTIEDGAITQVPRVYEMNAQTEDKIKRVISSGSVPVALLKTTYKSFPQLNGNLEINKPDAKRAEEQ